MGKENNAENEEGKKEKKKNKECCFYHSSIDLTHSHSPFRFSFHSETLLSPPLTASTFPLRLQLTRHSTASNCSTVLCHFSPAAPPRSPSSLPPAPAPLPSGPASPVAPDLCAESVLLLLVLLFVLFFVVPVGACDEDADDVGVAQVQIRTVLSWLADAMYDFCSTVGAHATSRTQSVWPVRVMLWFQDLCSMLFNVIVTCWLVGC